MGYVDKQSISRNEIKHFKKYTSEYIEYASALKTAASGPLLSP